MDNYMHHLFKNIISKLATAMKSYENNLAADRMAHFQVSPHPISACVRGFLSADTDD